MVEHDSQVTVPGGDVRPVVFISVRQREGHVGTRPEVNRVESPEPLTRQDTVVGGVFQVVFEARTHFGRGGEDDAPLVEPEAVAVVAKFGNRLPVGVERLRRGRFDDVAHAVGRCARVGRHPPQVVALCGGRSQPAGVEAHPRSKRRRVARRVGTAHVKRAELRTAREIAFDAVAGFCEDRLDERRHVQEGMVVVHREDPFGRQQIRRAVLLRVFVAADREKLYGRIVRPAVRDGRREQARMIIDAQGAEHPPGGIFRPAGTAFADFDPVPLARSFEQPYRPGQQLRPFGREHSPVERGVEPPCGMRVAGESQKRFVTGRRGERELLRPAFPCGFHVREFRGGVTPDGDGLPGQVTGLRVDRQFHGIPVLRLGRISISRQVTAPCRCRTLFSVTTSTAV